MAKAGGERGEEERRGGGAFVAGLAGVLLVDGGLDVRGGRAWERRGEDIHGTEIWKGLPGMCSSPHLTTRV